jgi:hypothetical protein
LNYQAIRAITSVFNGDVHHSRSNSHLPWLNTVLKQHEPDHRYWLTDRLALNLLGLGCFL